MDPNAPTSFFAWFWYLVKSEAATLGAAGIAGAIAIAMVEWEGYLKLIRQMIVGGLCAIYLNDLVIKIFLFFVGFTTFDIEPDESLFAFISGCFGMVALEYGIHVFRARTKFLKENPQPPARSPTHGAPSDAGDLNDGLD